MALKLLREYDWLAGWQQVLYFQDSFYFGFGFSVSLKTTKFLQLHFILKSSDEEIIIFYS